MNRIMSITIASSKQRGKHAALPPDPAPEKKRGYATGTLPVIAVDDERYWTVADAARLLGPPDLDEAQVRQLVNLCSLEPVGKRPGGSRRRHVRVYRAEQLVRAYQAIASVLTPAA
jgi:hypothetical protein